MQKRSRPLAGAGRADRLSVSEFGVTTPILIDSWGNHRRRRPRHGGKGDGPGDCAMHRSRDLTPALLGKPIGKLSLGRAAQGHDRG